MWLGLDLIGVVLPSETPSVKPDNQSRVFGVEVFVNYIFGSIRTITKFWCVQK